MENNGRITAAAALLAVAGSLQAQQVWRCGDTYAQQPCPGGKAVQAAPPAPSAADRAQTAANVKRDAALASSMEKERLRQEAQAPSAYIPPPRMEPAHEPHKWPEKAGTRKLDVFTAVAPGSKPQKKAKDKKSDKAADAAGTR